MAGRPFYVSPDGSVTEQGLFLLYSADEQDLPINRPDRLPDKPADADYLVQECRRDGQVAWYFAWDTGEKVERCSEIAFGPYTVKPNVYFRLTR